MKTNLVICTHEHRHGISTWAFRTPLTLDQLPRDTAVAKILGIDFEPDRGETLEFDIIDEDSIESFDHRWRPLKNPPANPED